MPSQRTCDGVRRRDFLKVGALGAGSLTLAGYLRGQAHGAVQRAKATSAIFVNLAGGPSHIDTFDSKPEAPDEIRSEFAAISTNAPGVEVSEMLPQLAACADKFALLRGVSHTLAAHDLGSRYLNSGNRPLPSLEFPGYGAVVTKELPGESDLPPFVAIPSTPQRAGYLGVQHAAFETRAAPKIGKRFAVRGISLGRGLTVDDVERRHDLLADLDTTFAELDEQNELVGGLDRFSEQAHEIISSRRARHAFDVSQESPETAESFGPHAFGQSCLLAARLIEAGVRFATVNFTGWDTHNDNFKRLREKLPELDQGLAALLTTLDQRGLLDSTVVFVTGEFGRTPKINPRAGRDHWPRAMFCLLAGGGVQGGQVIGASDDRGQGPAADSITPDAVAASFYHCLGIDWRKEHHTSTGRPVMIVRDGELIPELFG